MGTRPKDPNPSAMLAFSCSPSCPYSASHGSSSKTLVGKVDAQSILQFGPADNATSDSVCSDSGGSVVTKLRLPLVTSDVIVYWNILSPRKINNQAAVRMIRGGILKDSSSAMVLVDVGEDVIFALSAIDNSADDNHLEAVGVAALAVLSGSEREDTALVGPKFEEMDVAFIKKTYSALVCVFLEASRNDLSQTEILSFLRSECGFSEAKGEIVSRLFAERKDELRALLSQSGNHSYFPQLAGVDWKLEYCVPSPDNGAVRELLYRVGLKLIDREEGQEDRIEFIASVEELQELVSGLKDACKSVERALDRR